MSFQGPSTSAENAAVLPEERFTGATFADLAAVVAAWPTLPAALRAGIIAIVKAAWVIET
jgi:hypothetical protein